MATAPDPDRIDPQSPPERPAAPSPAERPVPQQPEIVPNEPDIDRPDISPGEWQPPA